MEEDQKEYVLRTWTVVDAEGWYRDIEAHYTGTSTTGYVSLFRKDEVNMGIVATFYHPVAVFLKEEESCSTIT